MTLTSTPAFLRHVMLLDAASCLATAVFQLALAGTLYHLFGIPAPLLTATGAFLMLYAVAAAVVGVNASRARPFIALFALGNVGWGLACIALPATGQLAPTGLGHAWLYAQAAVVFGLAALQWAGLRAPRTHLVC